MRVYLAFRKEMAVPGDGVLLGVYSSRAKARARIQHDECDDWSEHTIREVDVDTDFTFLEWLSQ